MANTMPADALATLGDSASAGMILTPKIWSIPSPASEELMDVLLQDCDISIADSLEIPCPVLYHRNAF